MIQLLKSVCWKYLNYRRQCINTSNRKRLTNQDPSLICSNCLDGILYHKLGLRFNSPFINLYLPNKDFLLALENWQKFIDTPIVEDRESSERYPVGIGYGHTHIHFMHYDSFDVAVKKWEKRKQRLNMDNCFIMFSDFKGEYECLQRFQKLPFKNKVVFTPDRYPEFDCAFYLPGYARYIRRMKSKGIVPNVWHTKNYLTGQSFVDSFDYVGWLNGQQ